MSTDFRTEPPWQKEGVAIPPEYTIVADVIDDVRFANEAAMIRDLGGELWRIERQGIAYDGDHSSEGGLEDITPDRVIVNDGTIAQLKEKIYG